MAWAASNIWFYYLGAWPLPGIPHHSLMPDFLSFVPIDIFVGAGCGFAGYPIGYEIALMLGLADSAARRVPALTALTLAAAIALFVNFVLTGFTLF